MNHTHPTLEEQERAAYMAGDTRTADLLARADALEELESNTGEALEDIPAILEAVEDLGGLTKINRELEELELLRAFFRDCFECLGAHYPCPEVTSDHDKSVIFDAIRKGEGIED